MSRKRIDHVGNEIYARYLGGESKKYVSSPVNNRVAVLERMYMRVLTELAVNRFKWEGMPKTVDVRFMELKLFYNALSVFTFDKDTYSFYALAGGTAGMPNMIDDPTSFYVTGNQFITKTLSAMPRVETVIDPVTKESVTKLLPPECVPIWSNYLRVPDLDIVLIYANKLAEIDRTIEINLKSARRTKVGVSNENQRLSMVNINRQIDEGQAFIQTSMDPGEIIQALDFGVEPDSIEKLSIVRSRLWSECMGLLGINNANQDKKERLVAAEVGANDEQVDAMKAVNLNARKMAAEKINALYGLNVSVSFQSDVENQMASAVDNDDVVDAEVVEDKPKQKEIA